MAEAEWTADEDESEGLGVAAGSIDLEVEAAEDDCGSIGSEGSAVVFRLEVAGFGSSVEAAANAPTGFRGNDGWPTRDDPDAEECSSCRNLASILAILSSVLKGTVSIATYANSTWLYPEVLPPPALLMMLRDVGLFMSLYSRLDLADVEPS